MKLQKLLSKVMGKGFKKAPEPEAEIVALALVSLVLSVFAYASMVIARMPAGAKAAFKPNDPTLVVLPIIIVLTLIVLFHFASKYHKE